MEVLPDDVTELLKSYDFNCYIVERSALTTVTSVDAAVFGFLRDLPCGAISSALNQLDKWFGKRPSMERCICLIVITDYVSCAYKHKWFYNTFSNALTTKFIDSLFMKLWIEWQKIFGSQFIDFSSAELNSINKMLRMSVDRFPQHFRHKELLNRIMSLSENYSKPDPAPLLKNTAKEMFECRKISSSQQNANSFQWNKNTFPSSKSPAQLNSNPPHSNKNSVQSNTNSVQSGLEPTKGKAEYDCDCHVLSVKQRKISKFNDMTRYIVSKENTITENSISGCQVPQNMNKLFYKLDSFQKSSVISGRDIPNNCVIDLVNCDDECDKKVQQISDTKEPAKPKILNAFDILMRKTALKRKAIF